MKRPRKEVQSVGRREGKAAPSSWPDSPLLPLHFLVPKPSAVRVTHKAPAEVPPVM